MKPSAVESLRGIQAALAEAIAPELPTVFAQETVQTIQMLIESVLGEVDTAAEDLQRDNEELRQILAQARGALGGSNGDAAAIVNRIDGVLSETEERSLRLSALTARNNALRGALEELLMYLEDTSGRPGSEALTALRQTAYGHLRRVAVRGWSFWDLMSFRERMMRVQAELR